VTGDSDSASDARASARHLEAILDAAPQTIIELDADGRVLRWNRGAEEMFGWSSDEAVGRFAPMVPESERDEFATHRRRALSGERIHGKEVRRQRQDGATLDVLLSVAPVEDENGRVESVLAVLDDISEQKRIETGLRTLQRTAQRLAVASTPEDIFDIALATAVTVLGFDVAAGWRYDERADALVPVDQTAAAVELVGASPRFERGEGIAWDAFESGEIRVVDDAHDEPRRYNAETDVRSELLVPLGDRGLLITASADPSAFDDTAIDLFTILGASVMAALARADREAELQRQNERLDRFASVVAHDLRNPLSVAEGYLELARDTGEREHFERVSDAHERIDRLVENLLTLARGETCVDDGEPLSLPSLAQTAWGHVETADAGLDVADDLPAPVGDPSRVTQLFENLFRNAVEHGGADVAVSVGGLDDEDGFYVADDGPGIPPEERANIFDYGETSSDDGTGFGLAIVADVASAHGWTVSVTDGESGGARFEFVVS